MIYIYALKEIDADFLDIRWVGQTNNPHTRLIKHKSDLRPCVNKHKVNWIKSINKNIELIILEETTDELADLREEFWISDLKNKGLNLLNVKPGGKVSRGFKQKPESIAKRTKTRAERGNYPLLGPASEKTKIKMSLSRKGRTLSNETKKKMSISRTGTHMTLDTRQKISKTLIGHTFSEETKKKMSELKKGKYKLSKEQILDMQEKFATNLYSKISLAKSYGISSRTVFNLLKINILNQNKENKNV
jgi:group I intron endonuclease